MSILSKIRNNMFLIVGIVLVSLVIFVLNDLFTGSQRFNSGRPAAGSVNGKEITADEFSKLYDIRLTNYTSQPGVEVNEALRGQIMDQTWQGLVSEKVFDEEMESVGLRMTSDELADLFVGDNVSPVIMQYFSQGGQFDKERVGQYITAMEKLEDVAAENGKMSEDEANNLSAYRELKQFIARARKRDQYTAMVKAGYTSSLAATKYRYMEQNTRRNISYLGISYAQIPDSTVKVTDEDLRDYINRFPKQFKQEEETFLSYVKVDIKPSAEDTARAVTKVTNRLAVFANAKPDTADAKNYKTIMELPESVRDSVVRMAAGKTVGPSIDGPAVKAFKMIDRKAGEETYAHVRIMKFLPAGPTKEDTAKALTAANEAKKGLTAANFAEKARTLSQDFSSQQKGGDLGWVGVKGGAYGDAFNNAVKAGGAGSISAPIKSNGAYYLIYVIAKTSDKFSVADISESIFAGSKTKDEAFKKANQVAGKAAETGDIAAAAKAVNLAPIESGGLKNDAKQLPGLQGGRQVILWGINDAKEGQISEVFTVGESYVVAQLTKRSKEGIKEPAAVRPQIEGIVRNELKAKIIRKKLESLGTSGDLNALAQKYGAGAFASTANDVTFGAASIPGIGMDQKVVGAVFGLKQGQTSKPIEGVNGVYLVQVTGQTTPEAPADAILKTQRDQDVMQGQMQWTRKVEQALIEIAEVKDERHKAGF